MPRKETRAKVFRYILEYCEEHGYSPTLVEIAVGCGLSSKTNAHYHVETLAAAGLVTREPNSPRTVRVAEELADGWIRVEERLPPDTQVEVLVWADKRICMGWGSLAGWVIPQAHHLEELVTHWRYLPAPPRAKG